jgi:hypothetical protein
MHKGGGSGLSALVPGFRCDKAMEEIVPTYLDVSEPFRTYFS